MLLVDAPADVALLEQANDRLRLGVDAVEAVVVVAKGVTTDGGNVVGLAQALSSTLSPHPDSD